MRRSDKYVAITGAVCASTLGIGAGHRGWAANAHPAQQDSGVPRMQRRSRQRKRVPVLPCNRSVGTMADIGMVGAMVAGADGAVIHSGPWGWRW